MAGPGAPAATVTLARQAAARETRDGHPNRLAAGLAEGRGRGCGQGLDAAERDREHRARCGRHGRRRRDEGGCGDRSPQDRGPVRPDGSQLGDVPAGRGPRSVGRPAVPAPRRGPGREGSVAPRRANLGAGRVEDAQRQACRPGDPDRDGGRRQDAIAVLRGEGRPVPAQGADRAVDDEWHPGRGPVGQRVRRRDGNRVAAVRHRAPRSVAPVPGRGAGNTVESATSGSRPCRAGRCSVPRVGSADVQRSRTVSATASPSGEIEAAAAVTVRAGGVASTVAGQDRVAAFPAASKSRSVTR